MACFNMFLIGFVGGWGYCTCECSFHRGHMRTSNPLKLELIDSCELSDMVAENQIWIPCKTILFLFYVDGRFAFIYVCPPLVCSSCEVQKKVLGPLEQEL